MAESDKIWEEIKDKKINVFALPAKKVSECVEKVNIPANQLYVKITVGAVLTALEETLGEDFTVEMAEKFTIISRKTK